MGIEWIDNPKFIRKWLAKEELDELRKEWKKLNDELNRLRKNQPQEIIFVEDHLL